MPPRDTTWQDRSGQALTLLLVWLLASLVFFLEILAWKVPARVPLFAPLVDPTIEKLWVSRNQAAIQFLIYALLIAGVCTTLAAYWGSWRHRMTLVAAWGGGVFYAITFHNAEILAVIRVVMWYYLR